MKVFEKDGYIYIEYNAYIYPGGDTLIIKKFKKEEMNYLEWKKGPKGGDHGWNIKGFETNLYPTTINSRHYAIGENYETLHDGEFWKGRKEIMDKLVEVTGLKIQEILVD